MEGTSVERATLLILVPSASVGFALAFNLGAFGTVFFDRILAVWVMATIVLIASLVSDLPPNNWLGRIVLLLPTGWLILAFIDAPDQGGLVDNSVFVITVLVTVVCLPFIAWILISAINEEFTLLPNRNKMIIVAGVLAFAMIGWALGFRHPSFLTCNDFKVSGNDQPANCVKELESS